MYIYIYVITFIIKIIKKNVDSKATLFDKNYYIIYIYIYIYMSLMNNLFAINSIEHFVPTLILTFMANLKGPKIPFLPTGFQAQWLLLFLNYHRRLKIISEALEQYVEGGRVSHQLGHVCSW